MDRDTGRSALDARLESALNEALNGGYRTLDRYSTDQERALFRLRRTILDRPVLKGPGESPLKEARDIVVVSGSIRARYALWENRNLKVFQTRFYSSDRAPLWYTRDFLLAGCWMESPKTLRMCRGMEIVDSSLKGTESLWQIDDFAIDGFRLESYYPFLECHRGKIRNLEMTGKYSFQHCSDIEIADSTLRTKDAFWHSRNITVRDSTLIGEYIGWYARDLTFINCRFSGTQPFVESRDLTFIDCTFDETCDRAFESSVITLKNTEIALEPYKPTRIISKNQ